MTARSSPHRETRALMRLRRDVRGAVSGRLTDVAVANARILIRYLDRISITRRNSATGSLSLLMLRHRTAGPL